MRISCLVFFAFLAGLTGCQAAIASVSDLRADYRDNPLGVDDPAPRLSWVLASPERGQVQSAYQILVATSPERLGRDQGDLWDSGKVASAQQNQIAYAGQPLSSWEPCWWKVRVWDGAGIASAWSQPASWTMGILKPDDWKGTWITAPLQKSQSLLLRHEFDVKPGLVRATVVICGLGFYEMSLNGNKVSDDILTPGWSKYDKTCLYDMYDVTPSLVSGRNCVGIMLGNGMYHVDGGNRYRKFDHSFGPQQAIAQLLLEYGDGTQEVIATGPDWRAGQGPITFDSIYGGEDYDARLAQVGWNTSGFDDHAWVHAQTVAGPGGALKGTSCAAPPIRFFQTFKPAKVTAVSPGVSIYDFGQNAAQIPELTTSGPAGSSVKISPAELLNEKGDDISQSSTGSPIYCVYTLAGTGSEAWLPRFYYGGYRFLKVETSPAAAGGDLPTIDALDSRVVHSSSRPAGEFSTSNDLINRIYTMVRWAQLNNMMSVLTDCPHRERLGWLEQAHLNGPALRYDFDMNALYGKIMNDMADSQLDSGMVPSTAPEYTIFSDSYRDIPQWAGSFIQIPAQQNRFAGDTSLFQRYYDQMAKYMAHVQQGVHNGILGGGLGDWRSLDAPPGEVTNNAILFQDAVAMAHFAEVLGKTDDAAHYHQLATDTAAAYNKAYFDPQGKRYVNGNQTANAMALDLGFVPEGARANVLDSLVKSIQAKGNTTGEIGFPYLLRALAKGGRSDVIYAMTNQSDKPGYGYQLAHGSTSMTEDWDFHPDASQDHFMLGQIVEWFYHDLGGIQQEEGTDGFQQIIIKPRTVGDLTWVKSTYNSIRGPIVSNWQKASGLISMDVTIPPNCTATIYVPTNDAASVMENGAPAAQARGVRLIGSDPDAAEFGVGSGTYHFACRAAGE